MVNGSPESATLFRLGLIGYPLGHSFSAGYFNSKFKELNIPGAYYLYPLKKVEDFLTLIANDRTIIGLNVTIPYKQAVMPYLDELSEDAERIGAVNLITVIRNNESDGKYYLKGYNSDWTGFRDSLLPYLNDGMDKALILGTGGSSRAVAYALKTLGRKVDFVSRQKRESSEESTYYTYEELSEDIIRDHLLIINTTPLGMYPNTDACPPIPYKALTEEHLCYDLIYNPASTAFIKACSGNGAKVKNGLEMLHLQAEGTWKTIQETLNDKAE